MTLIDFFTQQFLHNQFFTAAILAAPATLITYSLRETPKRLYNFAKRMLTTNVQFNSDTPDYDAVQRFVTKTIVRERWSRRFVYQTETIWNDDECTDSVKHHGFTTGYGDHIGWFGRTFCWVSRSLEESAQTDKFKETLNITFLTRKRAVLDRFAKEMQDDLSQKSGEPMVNLWINSCGGWRRMARLPKRPLHTVFTSDGQTQKLIKHFRDFEAGKEWARARGLPYHTGVLLYGPPGTGKSSLIHAIASDLKRSIYYLNLGSVKNDEDLTSLVSGSRDWSKVLMVIEDFDAARADVTDRTAEDDKEHSKLSLSTMLNMLDGLISPDGLAVVATTNHPEKLDPALLRPGRFDLQLELGHLGREQFDDMARLFDHDPSTLQVKHFPPMAGAKMRSLLLEGGVEAVAKEIAA